MKIELENCQKSLTLKDFEEIESKLGYALPERLKEFYLQYCNRSIVKKQGSSVKKTPCGISAGREKRGDI